MNSNEYIEVSMRFQPFSEEGAEILEAELSDLPYDSFVVEEDCLKAYIQKDLYDAMALKTVIGGFMHPVSFSATLMPAQNWNESWEKEFKPVVVGDIVTIRSVHNSDGDVEAALADAGVDSTGHTILINPQMAFGTGHHNTTFMMMEAMSEITMAGLTVMDMGCGTGVLGILAAMTGAEKVFGIDIDAVAAQSAFDNAALNGVSGVFKTSYGDASLLQTSAYDVLLANIHRNIILMDIGTYARSLKRGGRLLVSGFYDTDVKDIEEGAKAQGLVMTGRKSMDGWACLQFQKN